MDLRSNPRAAAAARRIEARTGFDVLDDAKVEQVLTMCARQHAKAVRQAAISGALAAAIVIAWTVAVLIGRVHVYQYILGAVLLALNLARLAASLSAIRKFRRIPRSIESARAGVHAAAESGPDRARWN